MPMLTRQGGSFRWTQLTVPHTARNCLFSPSVFSDFLSERRPLRITIGDSLS